MNDSELIKSLPQNIGSAIEYCHGSIVNKIILKQNTGHVTLSSFDIGNVQVYYFPFDHLIQVIEGNASVCIDKKWSTVEEGQIIISPAHMKHLVKANQRFKMLSTIIKSGYEDVRI